MEKRIMKKYPKPIDVQCGKIYTRVNLKDASFLLNRFNEPTFDKYILARFSLTECALISLIDGNRWSDPIAVENFSSFTKEEIKKIFTCEKNDYWFPMSIVL